MPNSTIKLYGSKNSGHSYKARLLMLLAGIEHDYRYVDIFVPLNERLEDFQEHSQFGEVPILVHGGEVISQSNAILLHLARRFDAFGARNDEDWDKITSWLFWEANRIGRSYPNHRYHMLFDNSVDKGLLNWFETTARADLDRLDKELSNKNFLLEYVTIADISCAAYLLYKDNPSINISNWVNVTAWLERIKLLPNWMPPIVALDEQEANK